MDGDQSEFDLPDYSTQWSRMVEKPQSRPKRATFSRRGSVNSDSASKRKFSKMRRRSSTGSERSPLFSVGADFSPREDRIEEEVEWDRRLSGASVYSNMSSSSSQGGDTLGSPPPPVVPSKRKVMRRANSVSDVPRAPQPPPTMLKRSHSVTAASTSFPSMDGKRHQALENFNPNFDPLEENASPKRGSSCTVDRSKRKKIRSLSCWNFEDTDFLSLNDKGTSSTFGRDFEVDDSVQAQMASKPANGGRKNPRVLQRGHSLPVLPTSWIGEVEDDDNLTSAPSPLKYRAPRKRRPVALDGEAFEASSHTRQLTCESRISQEAFDSPNDLPTPLDAFGAGRYSFGAMSSDDDAMLSDSEISAASTSCSENGTIPTPSKMSAERKILQPDKATVDDVLTTMSSEKDAAFLLRAMIKEKNQPARSQKLWNVALANSWTSERRVAFLHWVTNTLGFQYANAGGNVFILRILPAKGKPLLKLLQKAMEAWDATSGSNPGSMIPKEFVVSSPRQKPSRKSAALKSSVSTKPMLIGAFPDSLLDDMEKLTMDDKHINPTLSSVADVMLEADECVEGQIDQTRPSLDHHANSVDLMSHINGTTPVRPRHSGKPPRLSIQSTFSNASMASPFPVTNFAGELMSTPRFDASQECWGTCMVEGRDWGDSVHCDQNVLREILEEFEQKCPESEFDDCSESLPLITLKTFAYNRADLDPSESQEMHESGSSSSSLESHRMEISSPTSGRVQFDVAEDTILESDFGNPTTRHVLRREKTLAKRRRTALFASAKDPVKSIREARKSMFVQLTQKSLKRSKSLLPESSPDFFPLKATMAFPADKKPESFPDSPLDDNGLLESILDFLQENELLLSASLVSRKWFEASTNSHANLMLSCVGWENDDLDSDACFESLSTTQTNHAMSLMERPWEYLTSTFPWASFLSEGAYKRVYKVFNHKFRVEEAVSVMDVEEIQSTGNMSVVGAELAVSVMLGSLVRRGVCPNFVSTRGVFSCPYEPPKSFWGCAENKKPRGEVYVSPKAKRSPKEPKQRGRYQYIRMELCDEGDAEEFLKRQHEEALTPCQARQILFQVAFALHAGADRFGLKHYDLKLLNVFLQRVKPAKNGEVVLRYGLGEHVFSLKAPKEETVIAKLADFGTAKVDSTSNGQEVTMAQFTTLENTPPDFMILGDSARQGHGHDNFGLGLCMLHLFTGHAPYEEILEDVVCPPNLLGELRMIWEDELDSEYTVVRSLVLSDVFSDEDGHILEGEPDDVLYNTLYRYLVLFGIPDASSDQHFFQSRVMVAIKATLESRSNGGRKRRNGRKIKSDVQKYNRDRKKYSLSVGNNMYIARARDALKSMEGGMELLESLVKFNPEERASALDVLNSSFMVPLREMEGCEYSEDNEVMSYTALSTVASSN